MMNTYFFIDMDGSDHRFAYFRFMCKFEYINSLMFLDMSRIRPLILYSDK